MSSSAYPWFLQHLTKQWPSEIKKFAGTTLKVLSLVTVADLKKATIAIIQSADVIVCSSTLFRSDLFYQHLYAAVLASDTIPNRIH